MQGTYKQLMSFNNELNQYNRTSILWFLLSNKISEFYKLNGVRIQSILDKNNALSEKYFTFENGKPVFDGEGEDKKQRMNEGFTQEDYEQEWNELMNTQCEIHFKMLSSFVDAKSQKMQIVN